MMLCLDVGNSQIYGGVFDDDRIILQFRRASLGSFSSDEVGVFLRSVIKENGIDPSHINMISVCTVVPEMLHSIRNACRKYFKLTPFVLQAGVKTGLNIRYRNPLELGADRIANAIAAAHLYPNENLVIVDMGTATTFCAVNAQKEFLGGSIIPGLRIAMRSLESNTAKLPTVEIIESKSALGKSTVEGIQGGLYYATVGGVREITGDLIDKAFPGEDVKVVGTGGVASMFEKEKLFDVEVPDLILKGLYISYLLNQPKVRNSNASAHVQI